MKNIKIFLSENFKFLEVKLSIYLNRRVFVMIPLRFVFIRVLFYDVVSCHSNLIPQSFVSFCLHPTLRERVGNGQANMRAYDLLKAPAVPERLGLRFRAKITRTTKILYLLNSYFSLSPGVNGDKELGFYFSIVPAVRLFSRAVIKGKVVVSAIPRGWGCSVYK